MNCSPRPGAVVLAALTVTSLSTPAAAQSRPFTAEDMLEIVGISGSVAVSPAGDRLAFVLPDLRDEWNVGERQQLGAVHILSLEGGALAAPEIVGRPGQRSSFPVFSPDGTRLALYLEGPAGGQLGVWDIALREMSVGSAHFPGRAWLAPEWAGNSRIVYQRPAAAGSEPEASRVRVLESSDATLPGDAFFRNQRRAGLAIVDLSKARNARCSPTASPSSSSTYRRTAPMRSGTSVAGACCFRSTRSIPSPACRGPASGSFGWPMAG